MDTEQWEVMALDVRPSGFGFNGSVDHVLMSSLRQVGDVILVHDESAVERRWNSYGREPVIRVLSPCHSPLLSAFICPHFDEIICIYAFWSVTVEWRATL